MSPFPLLWGPQTDQLLADEQLAASGSGYDQTTPGMVVWALGDSLNSVRDLAILATYDPTADGGEGTTAIVNHRVFSAYGQLLSQTNPSTLDPAAVDCLIGFTGQAMDQATGLQNNLNRWYNPALARWMSQDPTGLGLDSNPYRYCGNDSIGAIDPSGLEDPGAVLTVSSGRASSPPFTNKHPELNNLPELRRFSAVKRLLARVNVGSYLILDANAVPPPPLPPGADGPITAQQAQWIRERVELAIASLPPAKQAQARADIEQLIQIVAATAGHPLTRQDDCYKWVKKVTDKYGVDTPDTHVIHISQQRWRYPYTNGLEHAAVRVLLPDGTSFYLDDGWWDGYFESEPSSSPAQPVQSGDH